MIVTIDGPAGSGKSSTARAVAERLGFRHLDSGAFYRSITWAVQQHDVPVSEWQALTPAQLDSFEVHAEPDQAGYRMYAGARDIDGLIRSADVNAHVSAIAALPAVRTWLLDRLRSAGRGVDLVADGRDLGTVVFPEAELKFFLLADPGIRAARRLLERGQDPRDPGLLAIEITRIEARDRADSTRDTAPLRRPPDAIDLDTTDLSFGAQVETIVTRVREYQREHMGGARGVAEN